MANGDTVRALEPLEAILGAVKEPGVGVFIPEIHRLRGECLLRLRPANLDEAMRELQTAVATAGQQQARALQLRAAISLARASEIGVSPLREFVGTFSGDDVPSELAVALELLDR
jgi:hypothetical protein